VINFHFRRDTIFDTKGIDKAPTSLEYDAMFKSLEPLGCWEGKHIEYDTSLSHFPFPLSHHLESSLSNSLITFDMTSSDHAPPFIEYNLFSLNHP